MVVHGIHVKPIKLEGDNIHLEVFASKNPCKTSNDKTNSVSTSLDVPYRQKTTQLTLGVSYYRHFFIL